MGRPAQDISSEKERKKKTGVGGRDIGEAEKIHFMHYGCLKRAIWTGLNTCMW